MVLRGHIARGSRKPARTIFSQIVTADAQAERARFEAVLKFYFSWAIPEEHGLRLLRQFRDRQEKNLGELEGFRLELGRIPDPRENHDLALATIDLGIATYAAWRDWAEGRLARAGVAKIVDG